MTPEQASYLQAKRLVTKAYANAGRVWLDRAGLRHLGYLGAGREPVSVASGATWQQAVEDWRRKHDP